MLGNSFFECGEELVQVEGDAQGQQLAGGKLVLNVLYIWTDDDRRNISELPVGMEAAIEVDAIQDGRMMLQNKQLRFDMAGEFHRS